MQKNIYRINDYSLLRIYDTQKTRVFSPVTLDDVIQYINNGLTADELKNNLYNTVWCSGTNKHYLNKVYSELPLVDVSDLQAGEEYPVEQVDVMIRQGYSFTNKMGLLIAIIDINNNKCIASQLLRESDFKVSSDKELIDGSFWLQTCKLYIPKLKSNLSVQITEVKNTDIDSTGLIYNYPTNYNPLIPEKPIPDYILNSISLDENFYLNIKLLTTENKTIEQSILDYFDLEIAEIDVEHLINYGNDTDGYKTIRLINEDNKYGTLKVGLDLSPWAAGGEYTNNNLTIHVSTEIIVNGKLMKREATLTTNITDVINPLIADKITHPETNFPVEVVKENVINQTVIESSTDVKVVKVTQPIFTEMIKEDIIMEKKVISFATVTEPAFLKINEIESGYVKSKKLADNSIVFDLKDIAPLVKKDTTYELIDVNSGNIIGRGKVFVPKQ